jgi:hypothetical protein
MKAYDIFFKKYQKLSDITQREQLKLEFMFSLSPDELIAFFKR